MSVSTRCCKVIILATTLDPETLLQTKLNRPRTIGSLFARPRLIDQLQPGMENPLTLISAPPGFGKTVLASTWLETCGCPSAWLTLDDGDSD